MSGLLGPISRYGVALCCLGTLGDLAGLGLMGISTTHKRREHTGRGGFYHR